MRKIGCLQKALILGGKMKKSIVLLFLNILNDRFSLSLVGFEEEWTLILEHLHK